MKTSSVPFTALSLLLVSACGMFSEPDSVLPVDSDVPAPTRPDSEPAPAPLEGTPVVDELVESFGVFVSTTGKAGGDGTRMSPFATIAEGIEAAKQNGKRVYVCEGTYREAITIADGISMVGGLDCSSPKWTLGNARSRIESPTIPAVTASSIAKTTRFERFEAIAPDATSDSPTSIALAAKDAASLTIAKSRIVAGNGASGAEGVEPSPTVVTGNPDGSAGMNKREYCWWTGDKTCFETYGFNREPGGAGALIKCNGVEANRGGEGGSGGVWEVTIPPGQTVAIPTPKSGLTATAGVAPSAGSVAGTSGASGGRGVLTREGFITGDGTKGTKGASGVGGAGGTGAAPGTADFQGQPYWYGTHGSGGGAGGCGGVAGTPGKGGGASIAAFVVDGAVKIVASELVAKRGGNGGRGTFGSAPTAGGKGGPMIDNTVGTNGSPGGAGSPAGASGSGAGGSSIVLVFFGAEPKLDATTLAVGEPGAGVAEMDQGKSTIAASPAGEAVPVAGVGVVE